MIKQIRKHLSSNVTDWMANRHPDFRKIKVDFKGTSWSGCDVFSRQTADARQACIVIGCTSDSSYITAVLYWTREGTPWERLSGWEWRNSAEAPATGGIQLVEEPVVGDDLVDGSRLLSVADPPPDLQEIAIKKSQDIDLYKRVRARTISDLRRKNPTISDDEIGEYLNRADRIQFRTWEGIEKVIEIPGRFVDSTLAPLIHKMYYLLESYGIPFLDRQLSRAR